MAYRFIHTADLHLDSPLRSLALRDRALRDRVDLATREAFARLVTAALEEGVDALMIAGDLFDGTQTSQKSSLFLSSQFARLGEAGIRVFVVKGNHDARAPVTRGLDLPPNVHVFDGRGGPGGAATAREGDVPVIVHGVSFREAKAPDSLLPRFARPTEGALDIGLMHTSLAGAAGHDTYAPCALADLVGHGFSYWGLGHVHSRAVHHADERSAVVMPGMPQGRDVGEAGAKSASLVTLHDDGSVALEEIATSVAVFARERAVLGGPDGWDDALTAAEDAAVAAAGRTGEAGTLVLRLDLRGESVEHWRLRRDADAFADELARRLGDGVHLEEVNVEVEAPTFRTDRDDGPLRELVEGMKAEAELGAFRADALDLMEEIARSLPRGEARNRAFPADTAERDALLDALTRDGLAEIAARIEGDAARDGAPT